MTSQKPALRKLPEFDNESEACRHCPTPNVHPVRVGGYLTYEEPLSFTDLYRGVMNAIDRVDAEVVEAVFAAFEGRDPRTLAEIDEATL